MDTGKLDPETLRRLALSQPEAGVTRAIALVVSGIFLVAVLNLVRRGRLREEYTPIWVVVALAIMALSIWFQGLRRITELVGAWTPSSTLYFFGDLFLLVLCLNYAVRLSSLGSQMKLLAQEVSLLREELSRAGVLAPAAPEQER
jgi:uncharacterized membrane protein YfbV (UPF0208 family)